MGHVHTRKQFRFYLACRFAQVAACIAIYRQSVCNGFACDHARTFLAGIVIISTVSVQTPILLLFQYTCFQVWSNGGRSVVANWRYNPEIYMCA